MIEKFQKHWLPTIFFLSMPTWCHTVEPNTVVATSNVGVTPAGIAITPDNHFAYVANNNNYGLPGEDTVTVLDLTNNLPIQTIADPSFSQPYTLTINAAGTRVYVTNSFSTTITVIDIATNTVIDVIDDLNGPSGMVITPNGRFAYVNNYGAGSSSGTADTVNVVDLTTNTIVGPPIIVGLAPAALAITPDGAFVYVVNYVDGNTGTGTISVIQTTTNAVIQTIAAGLSGPFAIVITPDGKFAYITNFGSNNFVPIGTTVSVLDLSTNTIVDTINLGIQPAGISITPDGQFAYVTNYNSLYNEYDLVVGPGMVNILVPGQGTVNIIDLATNTVIPPTIAVGQSPANVAISSNGEFAYISNFTSNTVNVIALASFAITAQGCQLQNIFLMQKDLINKLTWSASGTSLPVTYTIYRDAALTEVVAIIPATEPLQFLDHNRTPNVVYTYYLVGTNAGGTSSVPVAVTVTQNC